MNSLKRYWQKRNFSQTPEPKGKVLKTSKSRFVVQEHWATHHHFDFRLEMDGVLKSWAVPKGFPQDLNTKRLAIETEDHPYDYLNFEGEIPAGQYGAGKVKIFDKGRYRLIERKKDKIVFELKGKKLTGKYMLLKLKNHPSWWLLFKKE